MPRFCYIIFDIAGMRFWNGELQKNYCIFSWYVVLYNRDREMTPKTNDMKEVIKMKKEMMKLLKSYIEKYNDLNADIEIDKAICCDVRYDTGKIHALIDVIHDLAKLLNITVNMDLKGTITIAE